MRFVLIFCALVGCGFASAEQVDTLAARVIVLANSDDAESVKLARFYMEKRHVPAANLVALPMSKNESINWRPFIDTIYQPAQDELIQRKWIQAIGSSMTDKLGRKKYAISGHRISYLVVCRGVPLRIEDDPALYEPLPVMTDHAEFRTNRSAVDAELALLARSGYPITGFVPNPLFNNLRATFLDEAKIVKVARLDGPTYADAAALVDNAIKAEQQGLIGRAYVDIGGPHPEGDRWFEDTVKQIESLDIDLDVDRRPEVFPSTARFDAPVLYFGWYAGGVCGPFLQAGFRFPSGAIALHLHSFSAQTVRSADSNWCGPLIARGVTATFGNVHEPYLTFTHHPQLLLRALVDGKNIGDAAYFALPALSWQGIVIGDPLYRPFAVSFAEQWQHRHELGDDFFAYVVLRELNSLVKSGQCDTAIKTAAEALHERPGLVLAWRLAQLFSASGDTDAALRTLDQMFPLNSVPLSLAPIAAQTAQFYADHGAAAKALEIYRKLLALDSLLPEQRLALLVPAMKAAENAGAADVIDLWKKSFEALTPANPVPLPKP